MKMFPRPDMLPKGTLYRKPAGREGELKALPCEAIYDRVMDCYRWQSGSSRGDIFHHNVAANAIEWGPRTLTDVPDEQHPHLINGEFQSDKYPTTPRGKVPLSCSDKTAQDLLWIYAQRHRVVDRQFSDDLEIALANEGFDASGLSNPIVLLRSLLNLRMILHRSDSEMAVFKKVKEFFGE